MQAINSSDGLFHDGNPATSQPGTIVTAAWLNAIQGELLSVLAGAGIAPDAAKLNQVADAVKKLANSGVPNLPVTDNSQQAANTAFVQALLRQYGLAVSTKSLNPAGDLNTVTDSGNYYLQGVTANSPVASNPNGYLIVHRFPTDGSYCLQMFRATGNGSGSANPFYTRRCIAGVWEPWLALATTDRTGDSGALSFRDKLINGNFDIWQRGAGPFTSFAYTADRWYQSAAGSTVSTTRQAFALGQTEVPGEPTYYLRSTVTSVAGAGNYVAKVQKIESVRTFAGKKATYHFYARADGNKNVAVSLSQTFGTGGAPSAAVQTFGKLIALTNQWQKFVVTVDLPSISGKTIGTNGDDYLAVQFHLDAGATVAASLPGMGQQNIVFDLARAKFEEGSVDTPFETRPIATELALCQRYYEVFGLGLIGGVLAGGANGSVAGTYKVMKRATPSFGQRAGFGSYLVTRIASTTTPFTSAVVGGAGVMISPQGLLINFSLTGWTPLSFDAGVSMMADYFFVDAEL
ncbi:pyocin knob domain-containing protein [Neisseriaceae bacterium JH1-16]|nr:pyocin knob domain-containing protein [Neisseriaceae bacterium JH1-16]